MDTETSRPLDVKDIAARLRCHPRTIWRMEGRGQIPEARRFGKKVIWDRDDWEQWYRNAGRN
jgi:predicted DNA-binding transcriptional regulator AlpA